MKNEFGRNTWGRKGVADFFRIGGQIVVSHTTRLLPTDTIEPKTRAIH